MSCSLLWPALCVLRSPPAHHSPFPGAFPLWGMSRHQEHASAVLLAARVSSSLGSSPLGTGIFQHSPAVLGTVGSVGHECSVTRMQARTKGRSDRCRALVWAAGVSWGRDVRSSFQGGHRWCSEKPSFPYCEGFISKGHMRGALHGLLRGSGEWGQDWFSAELWLC